MGQNHLQFTRLLRVLVDHHKVSVMNDKTFAHCADLYQNDIIETAVTSMGKIRFMGEFCMQIRQEKVRSNSTDIKRIYFEAFPQKERMPFPLMVAMSKLWNTQFFGFYDNNLPCGFVYLAFNKKIVFVMFFAVDKYLRSKGYGSSILQQIKSTYSDKKIIISIEPCDEYTEDIELRKKRKAFYMRNGYKETGYKMKLNGVTQEIIITNGEFVKSELRSFFALYSNGTMWPKIWEQKGN